MLLIKIQQKLCFPSVPLPHTGDHHQPQITKRQESSLPTSNLLPVSLKPQKHGKMVGSADNCSKEALGMVALHEALRAICVDSPWIYSVFWTIRPRPRVRGGNGCKLGDDSGSLMLMWEDGFCKGRVGECLEEFDVVRKAFSKMSIQLYNYGEGLMGKVASDKCHKWVFKEPSESEPNISNYWQSSFDALPSEWTDQFESGIKTIAVIQAGHGLLQLGSCKIIPEDLHFVLRMRHTFESLGRQSGLYLSQLFSSNRSSSSSSSFPTTHAPLYNLPASVLGYQTPPHGFAPSRHEAHMHTRDKGEHESDSKWPDGLSLFKARMASSSTSAAEGGIYQDMMGTFLE